MIPQSLNGVSFYYAPLYSMGTRSPYLDFSVWEGKYAQPVARGCRGLRRIVNITAGRKLKSVCIVRSRSTLSVDICV